MRHFPLSSPDGNRDWVGGSAYQKPNKPERQRKGVRMTIAYLQEISKRVIKQGNYSRVETLLISTLETITRVEAQAQIEPFTKGQWLKKENAAARKKYGSQASTVQKASGRPDAQISLVFSAKAKNVKPNQKMYWLMINGVTAAIKKNKNLFKKGSKIAVMAQPHRNGGYDTIVIA